MQLTNLASVTSVASELDSASTATASSSANPLSSNAPFSQQSLAHSQQNHLDNLIANTSMSIQQLQKYLADSQFTPEDSPTPAQSPGKNNATSPTHTNHPSSNYSHREEESFHSSTGDDSCIIFLGDIGRGVVEEELHALLSPFGTVLSIDIKRDKVTSVNLGYGFVQFQTRTEAQQAKKGLNGYELNGKRLRIGWAQKNTTIFIGDLDGSVSTEELIRIFSQFGPIITEESFVKEPNRKYGFIRFCTREDAERAQLEMNTQVLGSRAIRTGWGDSNFLKHCVHIQFEPKAEQLLTGVNVNSIFSHDFFDEIFQHYANAFGTHIASISLPKINKARELKGFAFIHFEETEAGEKAAAAALHALTSWQMELVYQLNCIRNGLALPLLPTPPSANADLSSQVSIKHLQPAASKSSSASPLNSNVGNTNSSVQHVLAGIPVKYSFGKRQTFSRTKPIPRESSYPNPTTPYYKFNHNMNSLSPHEHSKVTFSGRNHGNLQNNNAREIQKRTMYDDFVHDNNNSPYPYRNTSPNRSPSQRKDGQQDRRFSSSIDHKRFQFPQQSGMSVSSSAMQQFNNYSNRQLQPSIQNYQQVQPRTTYPLTQANNPATVAVNPVLQQIGMNFDSNRYITNPANSSVASNPHNISLPNSALMTSTPSPLTLNGLLGNTTSTHASAQAQLTASLMLQSFAAQHLHQFQPPQHQILAGPAVRASGNSGAAAATVSASNAAASDASVATAFLQAQSQLYLMQQQQLQAQLQLQQLQQQQQLFPSSSVSPAAPTVPSPTNALSQPSHSSIHQLITEMKSLGIGTIPPLVNSH